MQFNSYIFILLFLPCFVSAYFLLNKLSVWAGKCVIIVAGIVFYLYAGVNAAIILGVSIIVNLLLSLIIEKARGGRGTKLILALSIILNISLLFIYKYSNFAITTINDILGQEKFTLHKIILPLGISFFSFQQIMYLVSVYKKEIEKVNVVDYLTYILYFPKLIMGPLTDAKELITQINDSELKKFNIENFAIGLKLFSLGLFKKLLLADTFAKGVAWGFANLKIATSLDLILVTLFYTFEIYFDFSGYSDMAVGISKMVNITLPINFDSPYKALSIRDFWKRWHVSLTNFLTKYIYFPLGGSRKGTVRTYINIMIVFLVSGIWHGANWTFILWGCIHGALQIIERLFSAKNKDKDDNSAARWIYTFLMINILWLLFRAESIAQWVNIMKKIVTFKNTGISGGLINSFILPETSFIFEQLKLTRINNAIRGFSMVVFLAFAFFICLVPENNYRSIKKLGIISMVICSMAFVWAFLCLSSESVFVYFNF